MKKILVIYFSQSGQLTQALQATLAPLEKCNEISICYEQIKPKTPFPFPWTYTQFFNVFPECVHGVACEIEPLSTQSKENFDLIIIAYQPWFLSVSIPINSFLQSEEGKKIIADKNIITIIACRNMWLNAQEKMKLAIKNAGGRLQGNIAFVDDAPNLVSLITVLAFVLAGIKGRFLGLFPKFGVSAKTLGLTAPKFGEIILRFLTGENSVPLQQSLNEAGAHRIKSNLLLLEQRGGVLFPLYANYIAKMESGNSRGRLLRVRIFGILLPTAVLFLSPIITLISRIAPLIWKNSFKKEVEYYSGNALR